MATLRSTRDDYRDTRIHAAVAIALGRSMLGFSPESLRAIMCPVLLIGGDADDAVPTDLCCRALKTSVAAGTFELIHGGVNHYAFLPEGSEKGREEAPGLFEDAPGLERASVHDRVAALVENHAGKVRFRAGRVGS